MWPNAETLGVLGLLVVLLFLVGILMSMMRTRQRGGCVVPVERLGYEYRPGRGDVVLTLDPDDAARLCWELLVHWGWPSTVVLRVKDGRR